jgi:hypothetical protein
MPLAMQLFKSVPSNSEEIGYHSKDYPSRRHRRPLTKATFTPKLAGHTSYSKNEMPQQSYAKLWYRKLRTQSQGAILSRMILMEETGSAFEFKRRFLVEIYRSDLLARYRANNYHRRVVHWTR